MEDNALILASKNGNLDTVTSLLIGGYSVHLRDKDDATPLYWSACRGHAEVCQELLRHKSDVNAQVKWGSTALHAACDRNHMECVKLLIKRYPGSYQAGSNNVFFKEFGFSVLLILGQSFETPGPVLLGLCICLMLEDHSLLNSSCIRLFMFLYTVFITLHVCVIIFMASPLQLAVGPLPLYTEDYLQIINVCPFDNTAFPVNGKVWIP